MSTTPQADPPTPPTRSGSSGSDASGEPVLGSVLPRLWTRPLVEGPPGPCGCGCALTPYNSYGFEVAHFARNTLGTPLDPWERWLVIHAGELLPDGRPRFRHVLVIVARQNGKTWLLVVLCLYWLFIDRQDLILSTSTNLDYAKEAWEAGVYVAQTSEWLNPDLAPGRGNGVRSTNGEQTLTAAVRKPDGESRYRQNRWKIAASNRRGGRSLSIDRLVLDELREHDTWAAWGAAVPATSARPSAQVWGISNMGDPRAVVLEARRDVSLAGTDPRLGIFEWSCPPAWRTLVKSAGDRELVEALAMANPNLTRRIDGADLVSEARAAVAKGGEALATFLTEYMCVAVQSRRPAVDGAQWGECRGEVDLAEHRRRTAVCVDVAVDGLHACAVAAAEMPDGRVALDVVAAWKGPNCVKELRAELPARLREIRPRALAWFPDGPAAVVAADMVRAARSSRRLTQLPTRMAIVPIQAETPAACMTFAQLVQTGMVVQPDDAMLSAHVVGSDRLYHGDRWRFTRGGAAHCDGAYAAAGATHVARSLPAAPAPLETA